MPSTTTLRAEHERIATMLTSPILLAVGGAVVLLLFIVATLLVVLLGRRGGKPAGPMSPELRMELLHNGLRAQATITEVRTTEGGSAFVTLASGIDPVSGGPKTYIQRSPRSIGRRGEPVTVLVDPAQPHIYLIVA